MLTESRAGKQEVMGRSMGESEPPNRHSRQAYIIIKTIHLMNFANAVTLARIMRNLRSETAGR